MTLLTAREVAGTYEAEAGPRGRVVAWTAVASAESGYDTRAVSPVGARGLYQFMPGSWPAGLGSFDNAFDQWACTKAMLILSGGGQNFAPWDSCYANIYASGRYTYLSWPEAGSPVSLRMAQVAADIGTVPPGALAPPSQPGITGTLPEAIAWYGSAARVIAPRAQASTRAFAGATRRLYR